MFLHVFRQTVLFFAQIGPFLPEFGPKIAKRHEKTPHFHTFSSKLWANFMDSAEFFHVFVHKIYYFYHFSHILDQKCHKKHPQIV